MGKDKPEAPVPVAAAVKRTVEDWAEAKGILPMFVDASSGPGSKGPPAKILNPNAWKFGAAKFNATPTWPVGMELTEAEFDAAVDAATKVTHG